VAMMARTYTIREFDSFTQNVSVQDDRFFSLPVKTFNHLEKFILDNKQKTETDALELMSISSRRGVGKIISAQNYVGLITMCDGTVIEILPKLYSKDGRFSNDSEIKKIFLEMLRSVREIPYKAFHISNLQTEKNNLFEIFIRMFIKETFLLVKRGLKSAYIEHQDNEHFYKGKINFAQHIKTNVVHKERFYIAYDIFCLNRAENRLIKSTLAFLMKATSSEKNMKDLRVLKTYFDAVEYSGNYEQDFAKVATDRSMVGYETILNWCKIFLQKKSFTAFSGSEVAYALLFPMEKIFESYIAKQLNHALDRTEYQLRTQDQGHHLFDEPRRFRLRPDIVVQSTSSCIVMDTKWKILSSSYSNYGISQADMYQMYAYSKKYSPKSVFLIYPWTDKVSEVTKQIEYRSKDNVLVRVFFVDLSDVVRSIGEIVLGIEEQMIIQKNNSTHYPNGFLEGLKINVHL